MIFPTFVPLVKIDAPEPAEGITTTSSAPDPVKPDPRIPEIELISIDAVVYPLPESTTSTFCI